MSRLILIVSGMIWASCAWSYDVSERRILGFSEDGSKFAFEESGTTEAEDDNVYTTIYVIDTRTDRWVPGSPIRHREDWFPNDASQRVVIAKARAHAADKAKDILKGISEPGDVLGSNPITELSADPHKMTVRYDPRGGEESELVLEEVALPASKPANGRPNGQPWNQDAEGQTKGFRLSLTTRGKTQVLHDDKTLPESRGQALSYRIADVVHYQTDKTNVLAVLLLVSTPGWEGADQHYLAVTAQLPMK